VSAPACIKVIAQNLGDEARALDPHGGQRRAVELDEAALRVWLGHFAALPPLDAEDVDARLHLALPAGRLTVRWVGNRLGSELNGNFLAATADDIVAQVFPPAPSAGVESVPAVAGVVVTETDAPSAVPVKRRLSPLAQAGLLAALLAILAFNAWWFLRPATPEETEWIENTAERQAVLQRAAGSYASANERLDLDAAARLTATNEQGVRTLGTSVRAGRRRAATVLVTEAGVVIELVASGGLRIGGIDYRLVRAGG
jgi:hypothetical protein